MREQIVQAGLGAPRSAHKCDLRPALPRSGNRPPHNPRLECAEQPNAGERMAAANGTLSPPEPGAPWQGGQPACASYDPI